jgi:hypothetical protein
MKIGVALTSTVVAVGLFAASSPFAAAAPNGLAWDSVSKLAMNTDPSSLQPGSFDDDYSAAAAAQPPAPGGGGLFGQFKQGIANAQSAAQMMQTGMAQKHYVAGSKERTDLVAMRKLRLPLPIPRWARERSEASRPTATGPTRPSRRRSRPASHIRRI